jgi:hypothetical protein
MLNIKKASAARILWAMAILALVSLASYWSSTSYLEWSAQPVLTTVGSTGVPITEIDFPSLTICTKGEINLEPIKNNFRQKNRQKNRGFWLKTKLNNAKI